MLRVGLTGGLASGKSFVGRALAALGCLLVKADDLGHAVLEPGGDAFDAVVKEFGRGILGDDGSIDRRRLAAEVFDRPDRLAVLNAIVHPPVIRIEEQMIGEFASKQPDGIAVVEAAILIETGSYKRFDKLIVAACTPEQQVERASERDGLTREEALARIARQMPLQEKLKYADYVVDTSGAKEDTLRQVKEVWERLRRIAK
ncbi:MAG TPA: dephospho-CoA kinase [Bryobacteraceae bacterium]|nr:dephospho-CoA kinase [Bryobacteraceae bacterium]